MKLGIMTSKLHALAMVAAMMGSGSDINHYTRRRWSDGNAIGDGPHAKGAFIPCDKKLQPFTIKGITIMAGSRKDAIKIYNHQNRK